MKSIDIIVETPKGSTQKYDYDKKKNLFRLHKILPSGMAFPYDFGFVPGTKGEDGNPLDINDAKLGRNNQKLNHSLLSWLPG